MCRGSNNTRVSRWVCCSCQKHSLGQCHVGHDFDFGFDFDPNSRVDEVTMDDMTALELFSEVGQDLELFPDVSQDLDLASAIGAMETHSDGATALLQRFWGHSCFRGNQLAAITHVAGGKNALVLMPTGGGTLIFWREFSLCRKVHLLSDTGFIAQRHCDHHLSPYFFDGRSGKLSKI